MFCLCFVKYPNSSQLCQLVRSRRLRLLHFPRNGRRVHELRQGKTKENHNHIPRPYIVNFQFLTWCTIDQRRRCTRESLAYANRIVAVRTSFDTVGRRFSNRVSTVPYRATIPSTSTKFVSFPLFLNHDFFENKNHLTIRIDCRSVREPTRRQTSGHHLRHVYNAVERAVRLGRVRIPVARRRESL